ncbi:MULTISPECIES: hypothetical protein [unclassified Streptomyces]|uniref:hypothetical protein n=1 Tax=unclassified Streptomyces TaxID=2593676 RepID=UPI0038197F9B
MRAQDQQAARGTHRPRLPDRTQHAPVDATEPTLSVAAAVQRTAGSAAVPATWGGSALDHP